jgi:hypothetical protein
MKTITLELAVHKGELRQKLVFGYDAEMIAVVKKIPGSAWSRTMKCWHIPDEPDVVKKRSITSKELPGLIIQL